MLANQGILVQTMHADHTNLVNLLGLVDKMCTKLSLTDMQQEAQVMKEYLNETETVFQTLKDSATGDLQQVLQEVKKYAADTVTLESKDLKDTLKKTGDDSIAELNVRFQKLENRVLNELADSQGGGDGAAPTRGGRGPGDGNVMKKVSSRIGDFEAQVTSTLQNMQADVDKKLSFMSSGMQPKALETGMPAVGVDTLSREVDTLKYDVGELRDLLSGAKNDTAHVKRIVLACERDMEDFTAAMDAVNVDLDEMRARVDSTHSIITSRQRVEATVTAEISTMRLDMGDMQEALKAHDAWMEDVSQSLQECHERNQHLAQDIVDLRDQTQAKLDGKVDIVAWNDMNDDIDASIKTVRDMVSTLRLEVDSRRRKVDEHLENIRLTVKTLDVKVDSEANDIRKSTQDEHQSLHRKKQDLASLIDELDSMHKELAAGQKAMDAKMETIGASLDNRLSVMDKELRKQDEDLHRDIMDRTDGVERHHATVAKETSKRLSALDLRISGLQGASGEQKRDINKLRDEVNNLTVKSAAHDVDIGRCGDDLKRLERGRTEDNQRHKQDMDAVYEELDQKVYEKNFLGLEDNTAKLSRGVVKIAQVLGVFPGARMEDGTEEELDIDVELLNWEDCCQNMVPRVEKAWRQLSSQKYKSVLDLVGKKADHSVLRLLQISQQHIESQLDRVRHERELWKEVVDKRAQQPLQLALTLKDQNTGFPLGGSMGGGMPMMGSSAGPGMMAPIPSMSHAQTMALDAPGGAPRGTPLAKRIQQPKKP